ncbi:hypothetical protein BKA70DRAFT_1389153 [Coprinopsis sp. MPI-PUGE-AT-0042]|nr:hypothetical protein BKA70DRAFT_1389153 [Coprinopsis sp. MPI-PUGE-AT-0042]
MSKQERKAYISAVRCITKLPSRSNPDEVPGARTRYDDFVAQHINQTFTVHGTGNFLGFHRYYIYGYERALREECGYKGYQPYWNWFTYQNNLRESPVFDVLRQAWAAMGTLSNTTGVSVGGGCIKSGPFKGLQVNLGPIYPSMAGEVPVPSLFSYNPRCLKRDLTTYASSRWAHSLKPTQHHPWPFHTDDFLGLHATGHYAVGGDAGDFFASPNDPVFWLHHAMVDKVWPGRWRGTITLNNDPPSRNATLEDLLQFNYLGLEDVELGKPFCYIYA